MSQLKEILGRLPIGKSDEEDVLVSNVVAVMETFGFTIDEVKSLPLPSFIIMLEVLQKRSEKMERDADKAKRGV